MHGGYMCVVCDRRDLYQNEVARLADTAPPLDPVVCNRCLERNGSYVLERMDESSTQYKNKPVTIKTMIEVWEEIVTGIVLAGERDG